MQRRLAAILAADMVGYSRLIERDEAGTIERLKADRKALIDPTIAAHGGDIVVEDDNLHGDGINIAARLESLAEPGGILVSEEVARNVDGKVSAGLTFVEERTVKNIERPVRIWRIDSSAAPRARQPRRSNDHGNGAGVTSFRWPACSLP